MKTTSKLFCMAALVSAMSVSCDKDMIEQGKEPDSGKPVELSVSSDNIILDEKGYTSQAIALTWSTGTNYGTGNAIAYRLEIAEAEGEYSDGYSEDLGRKVYEKTWNVEEFNTFLKENFAAATGIEGTYKARISAMVAGDEREQTSEVTFKATAYEPVTSTLYMLGDAVTSGWSLDAAPAMEKIGTGLFRWTGVMNQGDFKFTVSNKDLWPGYGRDGASQDNLTLKYHSVAPAATEDLKFRIEKEGGYMITADLLDLKVTIAEIDINEPPHSMIYFVSESNGWSFISMDKDLLNPFVFRYGALIGSGEFKFGTSESSWENMYKAKEKDAPYTSTEVEFITGFDPDNKWKLTDEEGGKAYKIALDITPSKEKMVMKEFVPYKALWLIGDAAPYGWSLDDCDKEHENYKGDAARMDVSSDNPYTYTYTWTGDLKEGELKFSCDLQKDWNGEWIMPDEGSKAFGSTDDERFVLMNGGQGTDNKWKISVAGNYTITINALTERMNVKRN